MSHWSNFYASRINSTYQDYFEKKYGILLEIASVFTTVREEGIGIGSVSKYLLKKNIQTTGFDLCPDMLRLYFNSSGCVMAFMIFSNRNFRYFNSRLSATLP